ncbi:MAG: type II toxin-antitoxin system VapC family toxin [Acidobacteria bacterium]|jgi:predicted nucleic acid-binding protein|nr:type II toxin-antitoxin system VapC family toxin [Acidobacteriota bacterium]
MVYWDTSALLKLYVSEPESAKLVELVSAEGPILSSAIAPVEMICALARKEGSGEMTRGGAREVFARIGRHLAAGRISIIPFGDDVVREAEKLVRLAASRERPVATRALDLIHLASAVATRSRTIVTTDARLRELAALAGLEVLPERPY